MPHVKTSRFVGFNFVLFPMPRHTWIVTAFSCFSIWKKPDKGNHILFDFVSKLVISWPGCWERLKQEKGATEDKMVRWHHRVNGREFEQAPGDGDGQGSLARCSPWGCKESDMTERLNWTGKIGHFREVRDKLRKHHKKSEILWLSPT